MNKIKLGIIGASGLVGQTILKILKEINLLDILDLYLITSEKNEGKEIKIDEKLYKYIKLDDNCLKLKLDIVIFSAGDEISKLYVHNFASAGSYVIDNSNAFRREEKIPLIVPEINGDLILKNNKIISNPNCSTIQLALVVNQLKKLGKIEKVIVSSYQSVSGAGKEALNDLIYGTNNSFDCDIKNNIIASIGDIEDNGFCKEENKIMYELNKILNDNISVYATTVRVPIPYCHGESVYVKFLQKIDLKCKNIFKNCEYIQNSDKIILPSDCVETNKTFVFRERQISENEILLFILADNLRRGAAYNAVLILEKILKFLTFNN